MTSSKFQIGDKVIYHSGPPSIIGIIIGQSLHNDYYVSWITYRINQATMFTKSWALMHEIILIENGLDKLDEIL